MSGREAPECILTRQMFGNASLRHLSSFYQTLKISETFAAAGDVNEKRLADVYLRSVYLLYKTFSNLLKGDNNESETFFLSPN